MAELTTDQLNLLRADGHRQEIWLTTFPKKVLWTAQINDPEIANGDYLIAWDNGATDPDYPALGFADIEAFQTVWVGTIPGENDVGKLRVKTVTSGDGGVTGTLKVAGHSVPLQDDLYLTFIFMYEIEARWPDIDEETEVFYRDDDLTYEDAGEPHDQVSPVLVAGSHRAKFWDETEGHCQFFVNLIHSYVVTPATTIVDYDIEIVPALGTVDWVGTGAAVITFTSIGAYWAKITITDSNGKTQTGYRAFIVASRDPSNFHYPITGFKVNSLSGDWDTGGWKMNVELYDSADFEKIPHGTIIILWGDSYYGETQENINFYPQEMKDHIFVGYVLSQQIRHDNVGGVHSTVFDCGTAQEILKNIYTYSVPLEASDDPDEWNKYPAHLTVSRAVRYLAEWHSTAFYLCDFIGLTTQPSYYRKYFEYTEGNLHQVINSLSYENASREKLICDSIGRFHLVRDLQLQMDSVRAAATVTAEFSDRDLGQGPLEIVYKDPTSAITWVSGFSYDGAMGEPEPWYALAPGPKPYRRGAGVANYERQTFIDQEEALAVAGRFWSRDNNPYSEIRITLHGNYMGVFQPHVQEWWELSLASTDTTRQLIWTDKKLLCRGVEITFVYENESYTGVVNVAVRMEPEAPKAMGIPWDYGEIPPTEIWDDPVWESTNGAIMTAGSVHFLPPLTSTWVERSTEDTLDMYEDPYWVEKQGDFDSNLAIVWRVGSGYVKKTTDAGETWTDVTPLTDPDNFYNDDPAPTVGQLVFRIIEPNYSFSSEFVVGAIWYNGSEWRSWLAVTSDDGLSWIWIPVI